MQLEHCQKCDKQIEFTGKKQNDINTLEGKRNNSPNVHPYKYCHECFTKMEILLQNRGYLPKGLNSGFNGDND